MTDLTSIPVLQEDNVLAFEEAKDLGLVLASLFNNGTSWVFIGGADSLRMQQPVWISLGLKGVPRPQVQVECTPRYQSPGALGCELRFEESETSRAAIDALLTVVAAAREGGGPPAAAKEASSRPPFSTEEATAPDMEFASFQRADEPTRKIENEEVPIPRSTASEPGLEPAPAAGSPSQPASPATDKPDEDLRGALVYRITALHSIDQILSPAGGIDPPKPLGGEDPDGEPRSYLLLTLFEFLGMKHFTGIVSIEWKDARPVESTMVTIRKGDLIKIEDQGEGYPDAEEAFLLYLAKKKALAHDDGEKVRQEHQESGKSVGSLLFEGGYLTLDRISASMKSYKEESFFELLYREGAGVARVRPKAKIKGHPIRVNISRNCIVWVRKVLLENYRRNLDPYLAQWMQSYPEVDQESTRYPMMWLLKAQKELKTAETVLTGAVLAQDCFDMAPVSQHDLARLFFLLTRYGLLKWRDLPKTSNDAGKLTPEQQLQQHLSYLRESNPFTRLGVHWATHPTDIETKYEVIARKYGPKSRYARYSDGTRAICQEILDLLRSSRDRLMDRRARIEERSRIVEESQGRFAAQFMEKQARIIKFRGERRLACHTLEMAIEIFPNPKWMAMLKMWKGEQK